MTLTIFRHTTEGWIKAGRMTTSKAGSVHRASGMKPGSLFYGWTLAAARYAASESLKPASINFQHGSHLARVEIEYASES